MRTGFVAAVMLFVSPAFAIPPPQPLDVALKRADLVVVGTLGKLTPIEGQRHLMSGRITVIEVLKGPADLKSVELRTVDPRSGLIGVVIRRPGDSGIWLLQKHQDGSRYTAIGPSDLQPMSKLEECKRMLHVEPQGEWKTLYADEPWYKNHKQPERVFTGRLERHQQKGMASTLMRSHRYKLGDRFLYPGKKHPELEKLVGQQVEVRGKPYDVELEGQSVREIWAGAVRTMGATTLDQALEAWIVLLEANDLETARKRWGKDAVARESMKQWWANLGDCHKKYDYRKWLDRAKQIGDAAKFKVGGHSFGHMHVDWEKTEQGWRIGKVWMCR